MNWKDSAAYHDLPPAEAGVLTYFRTHIPELCGLKEISAKTSRHGWVYAIDDEAVRLNLDFAGFKPPYEEEPLKYQALYDATSNRIIMHNLHAEPKGKGLGLLFAKTMLGWAHELGVNEIVAERLEDDGMTFWPGLGVMPMAPPVELGATIRTQLNRGLRMPADDHQKFMQIAEVAETNPYLAFRHLGLFYKKSSFSEVNSCRARILRDLCFQKDFIWLPSEASTAKIVESRLGATLPLRPLDPNGPHRDIIAGLHPAATAAPHNCPHSRPHNRL